MDGESCGEEARRIGDDLDLASIAGTDGDLPRARHAREARTHDVKGVVVQLCRRQRPCQIEDVHRERGWREAFDDEICTFRQGGPRIVDLSLHLLQRDDHVGRRLELRGDFGRAAEGRGAHAANDRHFHHRLLERAGDRHHHGACRQGAAVADDDDARKLEPRIDAARKVVASDDAGAREQRNGQRNRAGVAIDESGDAHDPTVTVAPSGKLFCPRMTTRSPDFKPLRISTASGLLTPTSTS